MSDQKPLLSPIYPLDPKAIPQTRAPFDVAFFERAKVFAEEALILVPELAGVVAVPIWNAEPGPGVHVALVKGRDGSFNSAGNMMKLLQQLTSLYAIYVRQLNDYLRQADGYAGQLSQQIAERELRLQELSQQLAEKLDAPTHTTETAAGTVVSNYRT